MLFFTTSTTNIKTIWHEASHVYLFAAIESHQAEISRSAGLFNAADLKSQNITTWRYAFEENLVRAVVAAMTRKQFGEDEYRREIAAQRQRGFIYTPELAELISAKYLSGEDKYADFDAFMPEVISLLDARATQSK